MSNNNQKNVTEEAVSAEIAVIDELTLRDKIYVVRGVQVMLDFELAEIYGYTTTAFNQQVKRNTVKFDDDFRFQLTRDEIEQLSISQKVTSIQTRGVKGGRAKLPWAFTESGIYMLMTVLKGDLATQQSKALIRTFRAMKDYIVQNQPLITQRDYLRLSMQVSDTQQAVQGIKNQLIEQGDRLNDLFGQMQDTVRKSEISPFMLDFNKSEEQKEFLFFQGQLVKADVTYIGIYEQAKQSVHIVDDYINIKTLYLLQDVKPGVKVTVLSDNTYNKLHARDYADF